MLRHAYTAILVSFYSGFRKKCTKTSAHSVLLNYNGKLKRPPKLHRDFRIYTHTETLDCRYSLYRSTKHLPVVTALRAWRKGIEFDSQHSDFSLQHSYQASPATHQNVYPLAVSRQSNAQFRTLSALSQTLTCFHGVMFH